MKVVLKIDRFVKKIEWFDILGESYRNYEMKVDNVFSSSIDFLIFNKKSTDIFFWGPIYDDENNFQYCKYVSESLSGEINEINNVNNYITAKNSHEIVCKLEGNRLGLISCGSNILNNDWFSCEFFDFIRSTNVDCSSIIIITIRLKNGIN